MTTTEFRYQNDAVVEERVNGTAVRQFVTDEAGSISNLIVPAGPDRRRNLPGDLERPRRRAQPTESQRRRHDHLDKPDRVAFAPFLEQVRVTTIEFLTGLAFGDLRDADPLRFGTAPVVGPARPDAAPAHVVVRATARATVITAPSDIYLPVQPIR